MIGSRRAFAVVALVLMAGAAQAIVVAATHGAGNADHLVAFVNGVKQDQVNELKYRLQGTLPSFMVPSMFIAIDKFRLTANGKVDRKALLAEATVHWRNRYKVPETLDQQKIALIWSEVLKVDGVGLSDNFFETGGNSLTAIRVISEMNKVFPNTYKYTDLYSYPTILQLTSQLKDDREVQAHEAINEFDL